MKTLIYVLCLALPFLSCKEKTVIYGEIVWQKEENKLELTLRNRGNKDLYFSYHTLVGQHINENELDFFSMSMSLDTIIESESNFLLKEVAEKNYQNAHKDTQLEGSEPMYPSMIPYNEYINNSYFFIAHKSEIKLIYNITDYREGSYNIEFRSIEFINFREEIKDKFYANGKISEYFPYTGLVDVKPITITFENMSTD